MSVGASTVRAMTSDFDFYQGRFSVQNRCLVKRLAGSDEWAEFPGTAVGRLIWGGAGHVDEFDFPTRGHSGMTIRLFDPNEKTWTLYWAHSGSTVLEPPVVGRFVDGRGEFFGDDHHEGRPIRVRYVWSDITPTSAHWEQAFSVDGEQTWETNWLMDLTRAD